MTTLKTNSKEFTVKFDKYILDCINSEDVDLKNDKDKIAFLSVEFDAQSNYAYNIKRIPNLGLRLADWFQGLPSCFAIDFANYRILEIAKEMGTLANNATEKQEDAVLANWFKLVANRVLKIAEKHNINF